MHSADDGISFTSPFQRKTMTKRNFGLRHHRTQSGKIKGTHKLAHKGDWLIGFTSVNRAQEFRLGVAQVQTKQKVKKTS